MIFSDEQWVYVSLFLGFVMVFFAAKADGRGERIFFSLVAAINFIWAILRVLAIAMER